MNAVQIRRTYHTNAAVGLHDLHNRYYSYSCRRAHERGYRTRQKMHTASVQSLRSQFSARKLQGRRTSSSTESRSGFFSLRFSLIAVILTAGIVASAVLLFGLSSQADETGSQMHKYYTSVLVKDAETLNEMAEQYADAGHYRNVRAYLQEVRRINHLPLEDPDQLSVAPGNYVILPYYSAEYSF